MSARARFGRWTPAVAVALVTALVLAAACATARREPPASDTGERRPAPAASGGETVAGYVGPDGSVVADTLARGARDTSRVERETVYAGAVTPGPEPREPAPGEPEPREPAPGEPEPRAPAPTETRPERWVPMARPEAPTAQPAAGGEAAAGGTWRVQVHASRDEAAAAALARRLESLVEAPVRIDRLDEWYRVRVGSFVERSDAAALRDRLLGMGFDGAFVVRDAPR